MLVDVMDLGFSYPGTDTPLFERITQSFGEGSVTAILGPSGSGKSTFLDLIGGLQETGSGTIRFNQAIPRAETRRAKCTWVLQNNSLLGGRTALDNAALSLISTGSDNRTARALARTILGQLGLETRVGAPSEELSGGEAQRVTIARALLSAAPIVLADEPTGQLDASNSRMVLEALRTAADGGKTVILATHDLSLIGLVDEVLDFRARR